jgi:hypothetical protein
VEWVDLAQERDQWRALVNIVMSYWVPQNAGKFKIVPQLAASQEGVSPMKLVVPVLWPQGQRKYVKCYKKQCFYNGWPLCEEGRHFLYSKHQSYRKKYSITSMPKQFQIFRYVILCSLVIKIRFIPFLYHKNCIRYSICNKMLKIIQIAKP